MTFDEIRYHFLQVYKYSMNFMTPNIVDYGKRGYHLFEISSGEGLDRKPLYGVTVVTVKGEKCHDMSTCFSSLKEAYDYARSLPRAPQEKETT
jgi:hypothetical protein